MGEQDTLTEVRLRLAEAGGRTSQELGFVRRVLVQGDRKKYYRSADNIGSSLTE